MPYSTDELKEVSEEVHGDPTLLHATKVPGAATLNDDGDVLTEYSAVVLGDKTYQRKPDSTLDWKNYAFEMVMSDGTRHDFLFTAKDDADAQKKVAERVGATNHQPGASFKLSRLEAPKELDLSILTGRETVDEKKAEPDKEAKKAQAEADQAAAAPKTAKK